MTRKDYVAIARALNGTVKILRMITADGRNEQTDAAEAIFAVTFHTLCVELAADNPRFDRAKFQAAVWE